MKILNLYSGIGGNRKLWTPNNNEHDITAVELNESIAAVYQNNFPNDTVIVGDAHQYLIDHYDEFDFIWSSPPCQSHSRLNLSMIRKLEYPDMKLYQEIIFLNQWFKRKFVIENVIPYYTPLVLHTKKLDRHLFWSNFLIGNFNSQNTPTIRRGKMTEFAKAFGFSLDFKVTARKEQVLRNCVNPQTGKHILDCAMGVMKKENEKQLTIFE